MPEPRTTLADALLAVHVAWEEFKYVLAQALFRSAMARAWDEGFQHRDRLAEYHMGPQFRDRANPYKEP